MKSRSKSPIQYKEFPNDLRTIEESRLESHNGDSGVRNKLSDPNNSLGNNLLNKEQDLIELVSIEQKTCEIPKDNLNLYPSCTEIQAVTIDYTKKSLENTKSNKSQNIIDQNIKKVPFEQTEFFDEKSPKDYAISKRKSYDVNLNYEDDLSTFTGVINKRFTKSGRSSFTNVKNSQYQYSSLNSMSSGFRNTVGALSKTTDKKSYFNNLNYTQNSR